MRPLLVLCLGLSSVLSACCDSDHVQACTPKQGGVCDEVDEPTWAEQENLDHPPVSGPLRPPPDCTVCSPLSRPAEPPTRRTLPSTLPQYLMSDECLMDHLRQQSEPR
jgi:hypothetical protein